MIDGEAPGETTCQQRSSSCAVDFLTGKSTTDGPSTKPGEKELKAMPVLVQI